MSFLNHNFENIETDNKRKIIVIYFAPLLEFILIYGRSTIVIFYNFLLFYKYYDEDEGVEDRRRKFN